MSLTDGLCECGCGQPTRIAPQYSLEKGWVNGSPVRFVKGHSGRVISPFRVGHTINAGRKMPPRTNEHRQKLAIAQTGRKQSEESKASQRAAWAAMTPERRLAVSAPGRKAAKPNKANHFLKWWTAQTQEERARIIARRKISQRKRWEELTPEQITKRTGPGLQLATRAARVAKPTSIERIVAGVLDALGVAYIAEQPVGNRYVADFVLPERRVIIECDGTYWHSSELVKARDAKRDTWLSAQGYTVVRLSEVAINSGAAAAQLRELAG